MMVPCPTCDTAYGPVDATPAEKARFSDRHILKLESQLAEARAVLKEVEWGQFLVCMLCQREKRSGGHAPDCRLAKALR
jgi:hypothetical protein